MAGKNAIQAMMSILHDFFWSMKKQVIGMLCVLAGIGMFSIVKADASQVSLRGCEGVENPSIVDVAQNKEFCFEFHNQSPEDMNIVYGFTDSYIDKNGSQICWWAPNSGNDFAKLFKDPDVKTIFLSWGSDVSIQETILPPIGAEWTIYGCLNYTVQWSASQTKWSMIGVQVARFLPLSVFIGTITDVKSEIQLGEMESDLYTNDKRVSAFVDDEDNLNLSFDVENLWNVDQNVEISGKIYNIFWFQKSFSIPLKKVGVGEKTTFTANIGMLPIYKWFFTVKFKVSNTPVFVFNSDKIDEKYKKSSLIKAQSTIYVFSRLNIVIAIVVLRIIIRILPFRFRRKQQQQMPPQMQMPQAPQVPQTPQMS